MKNLFFCIIVASIFCGCSLDPVIYPNAVSSLSGKWTIQQQNVTYTYADNTTFTTGADLDGLLEITFSGENKSSLGLSIGGPTTEMTYLISEQNGKKYIIFTPNFDDKFDPYEITTKSATIMQWESTKTGSIDDGTGRTAVSAVSKIVLSKT